MDYDEKLELLKSIYDMAYDIVITHEKIDKTVYTKLERREAIAKILTKMFTERDLDFDWTFTITYDSMLNYYEDATTY